MNTTRNTRKQIVGEVTSNKAEKTATVKVIRRVKHPDYKKYINKTTAFKVHDEKNECEIRDIVKIMETRPLSKQKRWRLVEIVKKAK